MEAIQEECKDGQVDNKATTDLTTGPVARTLVAFSLPFMVGTLLQTLYSTVDTAVVGQNLGSAGLSAVSGGSQIMQVVYMLCIGFINAGQVLIAQYVGARRDAGVRKVVGTLLPVTLGISVLLGLLCVVSCDLLLDLMNTPPEAMGYARDYVVISGWGMVLTGLYNMLSAIYRGVGDSRHPLLFVAVASIVNVAQTSCSSQSSVGAWRAPHGPRSSGRRDRWPSGSCTSRGASGGTTRPCALRVRASTARRRRP